MTTRARMALAAITHMETLYTRRPDGGLRNHVSFLAEHSSENQVPTPVPFLSAFPHRNTPLTGVFRAL